MAVISLHKSAEKQAEKPGREKPIDALYKLVEAHVDHVGGFEQAAALMRIDRGDLRRAFNNDGRYLAIDHVMRFGEGLGQRGEIETAQRIAIAIVGPMDLTVYPRSQMTMIEAERRLMAMLRRCPHGEQLIWESLGAADSSVQLTAAERVQRLRATLLRFPHGEQLVREALATPS